MSYISFDALRSMQLANVRYINPKQMLRHSAEIKAAKAILFPQYWQLPTLHFAWQKAIFPSLPSYILGHSKIEMTRAFEALVPKHVPLTLIEPNSDSGEAAILSTFSYPFVAKNPKSSMGNGVFLVETLEDWHRYRQQADVLYAQEYLPIDRDMRIVWIGGKIVGQYWRLQSDNGFHNNISQGGYAVSGPIPIAAKRLVTYLATQLRIDHAGFDIAMVGHHAYIFEFNRLFGNQGIANLDKKVARRMQTYLDQQFGSDFTPDTPAYPLVG